jgi:hypothetical protein
MHDFDVLFSTGSVSPPTHTNPTPTRGGGGHNTYTYRSNCLRGAVRCAALETSSERPPSAGVL